MNLQIKNNSLLTTENGRRVREKGIKDSKITCINLNPMHDSILVHVKYRPLARSIKQNPTSSRLCLLLRNNHSLWVRRDNAAISSHPLTLSLQPLQITYHTTPQPQFKTAIQTPNSIQFDSIQPPPITEKDNLSNPFWAFNQTPHGYQIPT